MQAEKSKRNLSSITGEEVRALRLKRGLGSRELARRAGVNSATISTFETGARKSLRIGTLVKIMEVLDPERVKDCLPPVEKSVPEVRVLPVVNLSAAQTYDPLVDSLEDLQATATETIPYGINHSNAFALRVEGKSLEPSLLDGDIIAVAQCLPGNGSPVLARLRDDGIVFKQWCVSEEAIELRAIGPGRSFAWKRSEFIGSGLLIWRWKMLGLISRTF